MSLIIGKKIVFVIFLCDVNISRFLEHICMYVGVGLDFSDDFMMVGVDLWKKPVYRNTGRKNRREEEAWQTEETMNR